MKKIGLMSLVLTVSLNTLASDRRHEYDRDAIADRIKPVGQIQTKADAAKKAASIKVEKPKVVKLSGEQIYNKFCVACHAMGVAGAPKFQDTSSWGARAKKGMDDLISSVTKGLNAMPAMGMCQTCKPDDFKAAIEYMLPK